MRLLYVILKLSLHYPLRLFYPRLRILHAPKRIFGRTIYVSNHAASFMDPLVIGVLQWPSVFFMTRSDIFTPVMRPILWLCQMLPIYRQHDGEDTKAKNEHSFAAATRVLKHGRNLLIFGEGFTDDVFIRRLKPVKKGAARIGFSALEKLNWNQKIYMSAIGINYGDPNYFRSDLLVSNSDRFCLNDYRAEYEENPTKAINDVTKRIEQMMQDQLTHVENLDWVFFHEHVMRFLRVGLHPEDTDFSLPLKTRWENSRALAAWMNGQELAAQPELVTLKQDLTDYFRLLDRLKLSEKNLRRIAENPTTSLVKEWLFILLLLPVSLVGAIHFYLLYRFVKKFTEKTFKRRVFWSSVKMVMGVAAMGFVSIPVVWALSTYLFPSCLPPYAGVVYYLLLPFAGLAAYMSVRKWKTIQAILAMKRSDLSDLIRRREALLQRVESLPIPGLKNRE